MRASALLSSLLLLPASCLASVADAETTHKLTIYTQSLVGSSPSHQELAKITYTYPSLNTTLEAYTPPTSSQQHQHAAAANDDSSILKLGFYTGKTGDESTWHGIATSSSSFSANRQKTLKLHLDAQGRVSHVGLSSSPAVLKDQDTTTTDDTIKVQLVPVNRGPQQQLNKPVVVDKEGNKAGEGEEEQKSFFQKYWWAIALFLLLQVAMGGGGEK